MPALDLRDILQDILICPETISMTRISPWQPAKEAGGLQTCGAWLQGPLAGDGPEATDMLSTLQAMSAHSSHMSTLPGVLNTSMQPPFSQQV